MNQIATACCEANQPLLLLAKQPMSDRATVHGCCRDCVDKWVYNDISSLLITNSLVQDTPAGAGLLHAAVVHCCFRHVHLVGQGVNQGFEDAVELGYFLSQGGLLPDSLRKFEASRIPRVQQIMACEMVCCSECLTCALSRLLELPTSRQ